MGFLGVQAPRKDVLANNQVSPQRRMTSNMALNLEPFGHWTLRDKAAQSGEFKR